MSTNRNGYGVYGAMPVCSNRGGEGVLRNPVRAAFACLACVRQEARQEPTGTEE